jgi:hypothetical protein
VTRHQNNYTRILTLRHESELLDSQIKTSVQLLADIRKDLLAVPLDNGKEAAKPVQYKHLLAYAKNISPFTIPPTFRPKPPPVGPTAAATALIAQLHTNTLLDEEVPIMPTTTDPSQSQPIDHDTVTAKTLTDEHKAWLAELNNLPFRPWPDEAEMASGALHILNHQVVNGNDPTDIAKVVEEEKFLEEERKREEEREKARSAPRGAQRVGGGARPADVKKQTARFGLDDDEDDDDDDD